MRRQICGIIVLLFLLSGCSSGSEQQAGNIKIFTPEPTVTASPVPSPEPTAAPTEVPIESTDPVQSSASMNEKQEEPVDDKNSETVYITKSGEKYHRDGCGSLSKSKIAISKSKAISQGYTPCSRCFK